MRVSPRGLRARSVCRLLLFLALTVASGVAVTAADATKTAGPRVAALFTQSVSEGNWDPAGYKAYHAMCGRYQLSCSYIEQATYEKAPAILRDLASKGTKLIIAHSSGYSAAIEQVAPQFPDTKFVLFSYASSTNGLKNYSAWSVNWDQFGYLEGVIAASVSKRGNIATINGIKIPASAASLKFIQRGAQKVNPKAKLHNYYVGSFTDAAKAKEVTLQAINSGADFILPLADTANVGAQQAAAQKGLLTLGEDVDESRAYPKTVVTSILVNFNQAYKQIGKAFANNSLKGQIVTMTAHTGGMTLKLPFRHVPKSVQRKAVKVFKLLKSGKLNVK